jgi:hypothetical protein
MTSRTSGRLLAMNRGRYGADVVIKGVVVFGALAAFITTVYVGIVVGVGALLGQGERANAGLQVAATAVVWLLYTS